MKNIIVTLTGPMAAGKNAAGEVLKKAGFAVTDADELAHVALENVKQQVFDAFRDDAKKMNLSLQNEDGSVNRRNLSKIVFDSPEKLEKQESLVHPEVNRLMEEFLKANNDKPCALNATVLYKVPIIYKSTCIIYITAPILLRLFRVLRRDKLPLKNVIKRFSAQKNLYSKYQKINVDIYKVQNFTNKKALERKILRLLKRYENEGR